MTTGGSRLTLDAAVPGHEDGLTRGDGPSDATQEDTMSDKKKKPQPQAEEPTATAAEAEESDTEGHFFLSDPNAGRILAAERERQIKKSLKHHTLEQSARPHKPTKR
jgi:hypothetical protein